MKGGEDNVCGAVFSMDKFLFGNQRTSFAAMPIQNFRQTEESDKKKKKRG